MTNRRSFLKSGSIIGLSSLMLPTIDSEAVAPKEAIRITIENHLNGKIYKPLTKLNVRISILCNLTISDGNGVVYINIKNSNEINFLIGGSLGTHIISVQNASGKELAKATFKVDTETAIEDESGTFKQLNTIIHWSMVGRSPGMDGGGGLAAPFLVDSKFHYFFVPWLRDHVHTLKGMKYYFPDIKEAIELFAKYQREDGMIADNVYSSSKELTMWDKRFAKGGFIWRTPDNKFEFKRIPVEADMEYLFIEGLYYTWKATGDSAWMSELIDNALKAVQYNFTDPYRWSEKYGLIKRGYTIDTWDFQSEFHIEDTGNDIMVVDKDKTKFGIMYGDNTGMIASLRYLAEMCDEVGKNKEAENARKKANDLQLKLDKLAWNGKFYTHHIPEDSSFKPDFGVNTDEQVSLSNTYSINRGITHQQAVSIIKTYQNIQNIKPKTAPAEWFAIYPPFLKGFDSEIWTYMNGGVVSLAAGELAKGAFEHGFEKYGVDILLRVLNQAKDNNNYIYGCYKGIMPEKPVNQKSTIINIVSNANVDTHGKGAENVKGWTGEGENDLHEMPVGNQTYFDIPFYVIDPQINNRKTCIGISNNDGYTKKTTILINNKAESVYFLQTKAGNGVAGFVEFNYTDNSSSEVEMDESRIAGWWLPADKPNFKIAWRGKNYKAPSVGVGVCGIKNPQPNKTIKNIVLKSAEGSNAKWFVLAISTTDAAVYLKPNPLSTGIPDKWGAAAIMYALAEGLVGIKDIGIAFNKIVLSPRWIATSEKSANCTLKYAASGGYCTYLYQKDGNNVLNFTISSSAAQIEMRVLIPQNQKANKVIVNQNEVSFKSEFIEMSEYVVVKLQPIGVVSLSVFLV